MKGAYLILLLLCMPVAFAQLSVNLYQEASGFSKDYGDITAKPGDFIKAFVEVTNDNTDRSLDDIKNIDVTLAIQEIDDGDDIEEDFSQFDLASDRKKSLAFEFSVPVQVEDKDYTIHIEYNAEEDGNDFSGSEDFNVRIDKDAHKVIFRKLEFSPQDIRCGESSSLKMDILDIGADDETVTLTVSKDTELYNREVDLEAYPGDDGSQDELLVAEYTPGSKVYHAALSYGSVIDTQDAYLNVDCGQASAQQEQPAQQQAQPAVQPSQPVSKPSQPVVKPALQVTQTVVRQSSSPLLLIVIGIVIFLAVILFVLMRKPRVEEY